MQTRQWMTIPVDEFESLHAHIEQLQIGIQQQMGVNRALGEQLLAATERIAELDAELREARHRNEP